MPKLMKTLNSISRCQSVFRSEKIADICPAHHAFIFAICKNPGFSQEQIAAELCLNKSTVARTLVQLEEKRLIERKINQKDKRIFLVYPTQKALGYLPKMREVAKEWNDILGEGISKEELEVFYGVLTKMEQKARAACQKDCEQ